MQIGICHIVHISVFVCKQSNILASWLSFVCVPLSLRTQTQMILLIKNDLEEESVFEVYICEVYLPQRPLMLPSGPAV